MAWDQNRLDRLHLIKKGMDDMSNKQWNDYKDAKRKIISLMSENKEVPDDLWEKYNQLVQVVYPSIAE